MLYGPQSATYVPRNWRGENERPSLSLFSLVVQFNEELYCLARHHFRLIDTCGSWWPQLGTEEKCIQVWVLVMDINVNIYGYDGLKFQHAPIPRDVRSFALRHEKLWALFGLDHRKRFASWNKQAEFFPWLYRPWLNKLVCKPSCDCRVQNNISRSMEKVTTNGRAQRYYSQMVLGVKRDQIRMEQRSKPQLYLFSFFVLKGVFVFLDESEHEFA
jgi:hypothetical protein